MIADALLPPLASAARPDDAAPFARVEVHADPAAVDAAWAELERVAPCSIYQTRRFLLPWTETLGRQAGLAPHFVLARDRAGQPAAFFALGLKRRGPVTIATPLGGKDANLQLPLLRPGRAWNPAVLRLLLRQVATACGAQVLLLPNQPFAHEGVANPLASLPRTESPSPAYGTALPATAEALFAAKLSKETRKKLRKKEAKLATLGPLRHLVAADAAERTTVLDAMLAQKTARFRERGIASAFGTPAMRAFLEAASAAEPPGVELHALLAGDRIVATYGGAAHGGRWSGMVNSFDADETIARSSPGDLLLQRILARCCAGGLRSFDLGIGEARYKAALCDEPIPLFDAALGFGLLGRLAAAALLARQALKRRVKRDPRLARLARRLAGRR